nr:MAG TPA: hypothetical protein [Caudoviricetes sp.]
MPIISLQYEVSKSGISRTFISTFLVLVIKLHYSRISE